MIRPGIVASIALLAGAASVITCLASGAAALIAGSVIVGCLPGQLGADLVWADFLQVGEGAAPLQAVDDVQSLLPGPACGGDVPAGGWI